MITNWQDERIRKRGILLLFSGGFDSTFVALTLIEASANITALSFEYVQRPKAEAECAERILDTLKISDRISVRVDLHDFRGTPEKWLSSRHEGWIPYRNMVFFGLAAHYAYLKGCEIIAAGVRVWDTTAYNDATINYLSKVEGMLAHSGGEAAGQRASPELYLPIINSHDPIRDFVSLRPTTLPLLECTWSCWRNVDTPCGECAPCITRARFLSGLKITR